MQSEFERIQSCVEAIRKVTDFEPKVALVLGSGLGNYADEMDVKCTIDYSDIPGFPVSTAPGHAGRFIFGNVGDVPVVCMKGRVHYYEGYDIREVVLPLRVLRLLGAETAILTNAVGAINPDYRVGDFVLNVDHISDFVPSPLIGENIEKLGDRFVDMTNVYDEELVSLLESIARENSIPIHRGVMVQVTGPQYETPTEIRMFRSLGADTVGMSTVVEVIAARHMGMRVCVLSNVTNMAAGMQAEISHEEVQNASDSNTRNAALLLSGLLSRMPAD